MLRQGLRTKIIWTCVFLQSLGGALFQIPLTASAQQLSIRHYDVSDGLAHSHVSAMHQDAKGYLWLATWEGLSRFDGYRFTNYTQADGLGDPIINDVVEDRHGRLWVATNGGGIARLNDDNRAANSGAAPEKKFTPFHITDWIRANRVNAMVFDSQDNLWCATDGGLYRAATNETGSLDFRLIVPFTGENQMVAFVDRQERLWFGMKNELIEIVNGQLIKYGAADQIGQHSITGITQISQDRLLVANESSVFELASTDASGRATWKEWPIVFGINQGINALFCDATGTLWIGTWNGLIKYRDGKQVLYTTNQGLSSDAVLSLTGDRDGNLWIGTAGGGVSKFSSELIVSFTRADGLPNQDVRQVIEDRNGNIYASISDGGLVRIVEGKAVAVPGSQRPPFTNFNERIIQDHHGDWWIGTNKGLYRFSGPELQLRRGQEFNERNGLGELPMGSLYEDPEGRFWVSPETQGLYCFDPSQPGHAGFKQITPPDLAASFMGASHVISVGSRMLWLGAHEYLGRLIDNRLVKLAPAAGLPETRPRAFFLDSRGWLWIGLRYKGVSVTKDPTASSPQFTNYSTENGLASDAVWAIAEDNSGRMYFGTGKGLDQLDLTTGRIRHFNTDNGLASDIVNSCFKDHEGNIWIGTTLGLSKFNPRAERSATTAAPIYFSRVQIAGEELALPETGALQIPKLELSAARNNVTIDYVALSFQGENELRYQYKLDGIDKDWSAPSDARSINYAHLAPGSYQFLVRAINPDGLLTREPASFQFRILPPIWQRWWFITLAALGIGLIMYALYRQRLRRLLELERVRTRIATDLHDDIGANLSLIAMLSEVSRTQVPGGDTRLKEWLDTIAATSRDTVDSMSDIVWAVNPKRDHLRDLTRRMRRFAEDMCAARNIELEFRVPAETGRDIKLGADLRREIFLIFKETINNAVRHSRCTAASATLRIENGALVLEVNDNGQGLSVSGAVEGTGLDSMRLRAERLGGSFEVVSGEAAGVRVNLRVPLGPRVQSNHQRN
jgi:ligand-binding sensor domain-containing protein/signal transduction histidine kinase